jgi:hypothetical protein
MMPVTFHFSIPSFMSQPMLPSNAADKREIQTSGWAASAASGLELQHAR